MATAIQLPLGLFLICRGRMMQSELLCQHAGHSIYFKKDLVIFVVFNALCIYVPLISTPNLFNK